MYITYHYLGEYPDAELTDVRIALRSDGKWQTVGSKLLCGARVGEESAEDTARRILSESGVAKYTLIPVNIYAEHFGKEKTLGMLYAAEPTSDEQTKFSVDIPCEGIDFYLSAYVRDFFEPKNEKEELWDIYDKDRNDTGRTHKRGELIPDGDYHLVVHVWVQNTDGRILLTQRSANKGFPHLWECSGGSVTAGEDSLTAAVREVYEETGLSIQPENGELVKTMRRINDFVDIWLFREELDLSQVCLQERETCDAKLVTVDALLRMAKEETLVPYSYLRDFISFLETK